MRRPARIVVLCAVLAAGCSGSATTPRGNELVYALIAEPVVLDGALVSDSESLRVVAQIYEGLTALAPGTTRVVPKLAVSWRARDGGRTWTFTLRKGVRFQDGTRLDASAVCFNFERWYGFSGSLQDPDATYYWHVVFGGFRHDASARYGPSLFRGCRARGRYEVELRLTRPYGPLPSALALPAFSIASPSALRRYRADAGSVGSNGDFEPDGTYGTRHPTGTGPFRFESWDAGTVTLDRNDEYWGPPARLGRVVFRSIEKASDRLDALVRGGVDVTGLSTRAGVAAARRAPGVRTVERPPFDVGYIGIDGTRRPALDRPAVRRALAYGVRPAAVLGRYPPGAAVALEPTPPSLPGYTPAVPTYPYDPARARALLEAAGEPVPFPVELWYPTEVARPYMPVPRRIAERFAADLAGAGFRVSLHAEPWLPDYLRAVRRGRAPLYLLGWIGDVPDASDFLTRLAGGDPGVARLTARGEREPDPAPRAALYRRANRLAAAALPVIPYVTTREPVGLASSVRGFVPSPLGIESLAGVWIAGTERR